jgi:hypothetical protein
MPSPVLAASFPESPCDPQADHGEDRCRSAQSGRGIEECVLVSLVVTKEIERGNACLITGDSGCCLGRRFFDLLADGLDFRGLRKELEGCKQMG